MLPFIAVEGPEGAGKGKLVRGLVSVYQERGLDVVYSREPGGTEVGEEFRRILKDPRFQGTFPALAELFGFLGARATYVEKIVKPALQAGSIVITDRFSLSTMAYQLAGRGLPEEECMPAIRLAECGVQPHYVILLVPPETGLARKAKQGDDKDRFAKEDMAYHQRVYEGYRRFASMNYATLIDADRPSDEVFELAVIHLDEVFGKVLRAA